jgi:phenylalanine-4-hydroxylase
MSNEARRVEHQLTDKGYVPVYTTAVVEQPWARYTATDHAVWGQLFRRQRQILQGRACREFLQGMDAMGISGAQIPKFDALNVHLQKATGWTLIASKGLLPELAFFEHLANARIPGDLVDPQARTRSTTSASPTSSTTCSAMCRC